MNKTTMIQMIIPITQPTIIPAEPEDDELSPPPTLPIVVEVVGVADVDAVNIADSDMVDLTDVEVREVRVLIVAGTSELEGVNIIKWYSRTI